MAYHDDEGKEGLTTLCMPRNVANVLTMAIAYFALFTSFQTTQLLASKLLGQLGTLSLGVLYGAFALSGFIAPSICAKYGPRKTMFLGAICYVSYIAALIYIVTPILILASLLIGVGAALIWTGQGVYLTSNTTDANRGLFSSVFWGIFMMSLVPGNLASHFFLSSSNTAPQGIPLILGWTENSPFFIGLVVIGCVGCLLFLTLRTVDVSAGTALSTVANDDKTISLDQIKSVFRLMASPRMMMLLPAMLWTGLQMTFYAAWFTRQMSKKDIGLVMIVFGLTELAMGLVLGKVMDKIGKIPIIIFMCTIGATAYVLSFLGNRKLFEVCGGACETSFSTYFYFYAAAALLGAQDCSIQTVMSSILGEYYKECTSNAFSLFRLLQAVIAMICFFISPYLVISGDTKSSESQFLLEILINAGVQVVAVIGLLAFLFTISRHPMYESINRDTDTD